MRPRVAYRWIIAFVLFIAYSIQYLDRVKSSALNPAIAHDIGLTTADIGTGAFLMLLFLRARAIRIGLADGPFRRQENADLLGHRLVRAMTMYMGLIQTREEYLWRMAIFGMLVRPNTFLRRACSCAGFNKEGRARAQTVLAWAWIITPAWAKKRPFATQFAAHADSWRIVFFGHGASVGGVTGRALIAVFVFESAGALRARHATEADLDTRTATSSKQARSHADNMHRRKRPFSRARWRALSRSGLQEFARMSQSFSSISWSDADYALRRAHVGSGYTHARNFSASKCRRWAGGAASTSRQAAIGSFISSYMSDKVFNGNRKIMILVVLHRATREVRGLCSASLQQALEFCSRSVCGMGLLEHGMGPVPRAFAERRNLFSPEVYGKAMGFVKWRGLLRRRGFLREDLLQRSGGRRIGPQDLYQRHGFSSRLPVVGKLELSRRVSSGPLVEPSTIAIRSATCFRERSRFG